MNLHTRKWIVSKLEDHDQVSGIEVIGNQVIKIVRRRYMPFNSILLDHEIVYPSTFIVEINKDVCFEFVMSLRRDTVWTGEAITAASHHGLGWGGLGDLMSAINEEIVSGFQRREYSFVERGLCQHTKVLNVERVNNRILIIHRDGLPCIRVVLINEYDLTTEHLRHHREIFGAFDEVLATNPNCRLTSTAEKTAELMGVKVYSWGQFMSRIHRT